MRAGTVIILGMFVGALVAGCSTPPPTPPQASAPVVTTDVSIDPAAALDGPMALSDKPAWVPFRAYLDRLVQTIDQAWDKSLRTAEAYPTSGSKVTVRFVLRSDGQVDRILDVSHDSTELGVRLCVAAITTPAPYPAWTNEMIVQLGEEQELTFTFHYR